MTLSHLGSRLARLWPLVLLLLLGSGAVAHAQGKDAAARAEARRLLRAGNVAYQAGNYRVALDKFEQAIATFPSARIQYNVGQALRELKRPVEAAVAFETFLADADRITAQERREATGALSDLESSVARLTVVTEPTEVEVTIGGMSRGKTPLPRAVIVAPGTHDVILGRTGYQALKDNITVTAGEQRRLSYQLVPAASPPLVASPSASPFPSPSPAPASPPPSVSAPAAAPGSTAAAATTESTVEPTPLAPAPLAPSPAPRDGRLGVRQTIGASLLIASAALAVGGAIFLSSSWSRYHEAEDQRCRGDCDAAASTVESRALWSKILFGAAAVSAGTGAALVLIPTSDSAGPAERASGKPGGAMLVTRGTF